MMNLSVIPIRRKGNKGEGQLSRLRDNTLDKVRSWHDVKEMMLVVKMKPTPQLTQDHVTPNMEDKNKKHKHGKIFPL